MIKLKEILESISLSKRYIRKKIVELDVKRKMWAVIISSEPNFGRNILNTSLKPKILKTSSYRGVNITETG